jgi:hypothetical protein
LGLQHGPETQDRQRWQHPPGETLMSSAKRLDQIEEAFAQFVVATAQTFQAFEAITVDLRAEVEDLKVAKDQKKETADGE